MFCKRFIVLVIVFILVCSIFMLYSNVLVEIGVVLNIEVGVVILVEVNFGKILY